MLRLKLILSCILAFHFIAPLKGFCQVNLNSGLVAHYPFNGNANDVSGNNHHGLQVNGITFTADRFGNANRALRFDGVDDYIKIADNGAFSTPHFSLVVWFQTESNALQNLIAKRDYATTAGTGGAQYQMFINYPPYPGIGSNVVGNNSTCNSIASSSYLNTGHNVCSNKWTLAVITFDGNRHKVYINGQLKRDEVAGFSGLLSCKSELRFGNWFQYELISFKGVMDDIRWYNRALTNDEVIALLDGYVASEPVLKITNIGVPCGGSSVNITAPSVTAGSDPGLTYSYWRDAAATIALSNPNAVGSGTYYIKANAGSNCSVIKPITVIASTSPNLSITNPKACGTSSTTDLTSPTITAGSDAGLSFTYWHDAAATTVITNPKAVGSGTYYIKASAGSACFTIKPVVVTSTAPNLSINNPAVCTPATVDLTSPVITVGSDAGLTYTYWRDAAATLSLPIAQAKAIDASGTYYIQAENTAGCKSIKPVVVSVSAPPVLSVINSASLCFPETYNLNHSISSSTSGLTITYWKDALATVPVPASEVSSIAVGGVYYIKAANASCSKIEPVSVEIKPQPLLTITNPAPVCSPATFDLTAPSITKGSDNGLTFTYYTDNTGTLPVTNPTSVGAGTYYIKGEASNSCSSIQPVTLVVVPQPSFSIDPVEKRLCLGESVLMSAKGGDAYKWFTKNNTTLSTAADFLYKPTATDSIYVAITSSACQITDTLGSLLNIDASPTISINKTNDIDCQNLQTQLTVNGGIRYEWSPLSHIDNPASATPIVNPQKDTWYKVKVTGQNSCVTEDSVFVRSNLSSGKGQFYVANAFSPNGDGKNDCFNVKHWTAVTDFELTIFNRWGEQLFYTKEVGDCWNGTFKGKFQPIGTYIYQIKATSPCSAEPLYLKGVINLIK